MLRKPGDLLECRLRQHLFRRSYHVLHAHRIYSTKQKYIIWQPWTVNTVTMGFTLTGYTVLNRSILYGNHEHWIQLPLASRSQIYLVWQPYTVSTVFLNQSYFMIWWTDILPIGAYLFLYDKLSLIRICKHIIKCYCNVKLTIITNNSINLTFQQFCSYFM